MIAMPNSHLVQHKEALTEHFKNKLSKNWPKTAKLQNTKFFFQICYTFSVLFFNFQRPNMIAIQNSHLVLHKEQ